MPTLMPHADGSADSSVVLAAYNVNAAMAVAAENSFEEMAAVEFDLVILTSSLATAVGLAAFRRLLQVILTSVCGLFSTVYVL